MVRKFCGLIESHQFRFDSGQNFECQMFNLSLQKSRPHIKLKKYRVDCLRNHSLCTKMFSGY